VLIEWDNDIPGLGVLLEEAARAEEIIYRYAETASRYA